MNNALKMRIAELSRGSAEPKTTDAVLTEATQRYPGLGDDSDSSVLESLAVLSGASDSLSRFVLNEPNSLTVLKNLDLAVNLDAQTVEGLALTRRLEFLRICLRDLLGLDPLTVVVANLSRLALETLVVAKVLARAPDLGIVAMGKFGGGELNYSSDIDIMLVGADQRGARRMLDLLRPVVRVDVDLRPEGRAGPLVRSVESYEAYWERWAQPWEFQALIKARFVDGPAEMAKAFSMTHQQSLWGRGFDADEIHSLRAMKSRTEAIAGEEAGEEIKRSRGGIRDIEFAIQLLQLVHGRLDPGLRSPNSLDALGELSAAGYIHPPDAGALEDAYVFLRTVEHRVQLIEERQTHSVPTQDAARERIARAVGFRGSADASALASFNQALASHRVAARSVHERLFFRPLMEAFSGSGSLPSVSGSQSRLAEAFGFGSTDQTKRAVGDLVSGFSRTSRMMRQVLPLMLSWLSESPDPTGGLFGLRQLMASQNSAKELATSLRENPRRAQELCVLVGGSQVLTENLFAHPDLIAGLGAGAEAVVSLDSTALKASLCDQIAWRDDEADKLRGLGRAIGRRRVEVGALDLLGELSVDQVGRSLAATAEAVLQIVLDEFCSDFDVAIVALGRFAGGELSYVSDLDLILVHGEVPGYEADKLAKRLLRKVKGDTPATRLYEVDFDLRPEGKQGSISRSIEGYERYLNDFALPWELQALSRARVVAGNPELGERFMSTIGPYVWRRPLPQAHIQEMRRIKVRVERERIPPGEDPAFHLKLGPGSLSDIEWLVQLLQLRHLVYAPGTVEAINKLVEVDVLGPDEGALLQETHRFLETLRNRLYLITGHKTDALPNSVEELRKLSRSISMPVGELREKYRRLTRQTRKVFETRFYGAR